MTFSRFYESHMTAVTYGTVKSFHPSKTKVGCTTAAQAGWLLSLNQEDIMNNLNVILRALYKNSTSDTDFLMRSPGEHAFEIV